MAFAPPGSITGAAQSVLTSPTYTLMADSPPTAWSKQYYVSALGGTQTGVLAHSVASPFTGTMFRPALLKTLEPVNPVTGVLKSVPNNEYVVLTRKGVIPLAGQASRPAMIRSTFSVPSGAELADPNSLAAAISFHIGLLWQLAEEIRKTASTGSI